MGCYFGVVGDCGNKSEVETEQENTSISKALTNMVNSKSSSTYVKTINVQSSNVQIEEIDGCSGDIGNIYQGITSNQTVKLNIDLSSTQDLQAQLKAAITAQAEKDVAQKAGPFTTATNTSATKTKISNYVENLVSTNITNEVRQELSSIIENYQTGNITIKKIRCNKGDPPLKMGNVSQTVISTQIVDVLLNALSKQKAETEVDTKTVSKTRDTIDQKAEGIDAIFAAIAEMFMGPLRWVAIIIVLAICAGVLGIGALIILPRFFRKKPELTKFGKMLFGNSRRR
jgi:hypothetical protein